MLPLPYQWGNHKGFGRYKCKIDYLIQYPYYVRFQAYHSGQKRQKLGSSQHESLIFSSPFCLCDSLNLFRAIKFQKLNQSRRSYIWWIGKGEHCEYLHNVSYSYIRYLPAPWRSVQFTKMTHPRTSQNIQMIQKRINQNRNCYRIATGHNIRE